MSSQFPLHKGQVLASINMNGYRGRGRGGSGNNQRGGGAPPAKRFRNEEEDEDMDVGGTFEDRLAELDDEDIANGIDPETEMEEDLGCMQARRVKKWRRPDPEPLDPAKDKIVFQQIDIDHYISEPFPGMPGAKSGPVPVMRIFGVNKKVSFQESKASFHHCHRLVCFRETRSAVTFMDSTRISLSRPRATFPRTTSEISELA